MAAAVRDAFQRVAGSTTARGNTLRLPPVIPLSVPIIFNHLRIFPGPGSGFGVQNKRQLNENKMTKRERWGFLLLSFFLSVSLSLSLILILSTELNLLNLENISLFGHSSHLYQPIVGVEVAAIRSPIFSFLGIL